MSELPEWQQALGYGVGKEGPIGPRGEAGPAGIEGEQGIRGPAGPPGGLAPETEYHVQEYYDSSVTPEWGSAFQQAIDDCLGESDPTTAVRIATGPIILPAGNLAMTSMPTIASAVGVLVRGSGRYSTALCPDGFESGLDLPGVAFSSFENFSIRGSGQVTHGIRSYHDATKAIKYPSSNAFRNVDIMELDFVNGYMIGGDSNSDQCDKHSFYDCRVQGRWTWGNDTDLDAHPDARSVNGFMFGTGGAGNNLVHNIFALNVAQVAFPVHTHGVNVNVWGGSTEQSFVAIWEEGGPIEPCTFAGIRVEGSNYLYSSSGADSWSRKTTLDSLVFHGGKMLEASFMYVGAGGTYLIRNMAMMGSDPGSYTPVISVVHIAPTTIIIDGLDICDGDVSSIGGFIKNVTPAALNVIAKAVQQTDSSDGTIATLPFAVKLDGVSPGTALVTS